jgi:hypothetical protein
MTPTERFAVYLVAFASVVNSIAIVLLAVRP